MNFTNEVVLANIPKGKFSEIVVRQEVNEFNDVVTDIRLRKLDNGVWKYTKHGITYPSFLNSLIIEALSKKV